MNKFIKELRRREVFRTGGLYVGVAWIVIEVASVILPTFDVAEWVFKALVITAFAGFPVALVLAWFYDITSKGVLREEEGEAPAGPLIGGRQMDFIVIGVLAIALIFSIYINFSRAPGEPVELEPVSVLIADFDNQTGDPMFDGLLEQALTIGIESAPNVTAYQRTAAKGIARSLNEDETDDMDQSVAQLVAAREGVQMVLAGSISPDGDGYSLSMSGLDLFANELVFEVGAEAKSRNEVLTAIGSLSEE
ncbi:MAG: hypothetical protein OES93_13750, partial [Gammaproteobacteria bacterium]|nr:hypothetical protein [Gammaproteobacteria bacterium]